MSSSPRCWRLRGQSEAVAALLLACVGLVIVAGAVAVAKARMLMSERAVESALAEARCSGPCTSTVLLLFPGTGGDVFRLVVHNRCPRPVDVTVKVLDGSGHEITSVSAHVEAWSSQTTDLSLRREPASLYVVEEGGYVYRGVLWRW